ncbi:hypothetical protein ACFJYZ_13475 [Enterococcus faecalis]|uniref:hypothetical protein n=1 Tax=Enterococcus sp. DIV0086 TaxID=2774655 RepID=UPI00372B6CBA
MSKKINLLLIAFLIGGGATVLPMIFKLAVFTSALVVLFMNYDEHIFQLNKGGRNNVGKRRV